MSFLDWFPSIIRMRHTLLFYLRCYTIKVSSDSWYCPTTSRTWMWSSWQKNVTCLFVISQDVLRRSSVCRRESGWWIKKMRWYWKACRHLLRWWQLLLRISVSHRLLISPPIAKKDSMILRMIYIRNWNPGWNADYLSCICKKMAIINSVLLFE